MSVDTSAEGSSDVTVAATPDAVDLSALIAFSTEDIDKPDLDDRKYRYLKLANNLQLLLVSDPECDHAAACADVAVGSASDPEELPGLAHFLEHMLFLGTAKYPAENAYQSFLEQHGGSSNAFTQHENTTCAPARAPASASTFLLSCVFALMTPIHFVLTRRLFRRPAPVPARRTRPVCPILSLPALLRECHRPRDEGC